MVPLNLDIYVCERSEQEKIRLLKIGKKINNQKQYLLLKIILKNFALAILGGGGGVRRVRPPLNPPVFRNSGGDTVQTKLSRQSPQD